MRTLYEDAYFVVTVDTPKRLLRATRSSLPFPSVEVADDVMTQLATTLRTDALEGYAILVDSRDAPGRNDTSFESMMASKRSLLFRPFRKRAMLLRTMTGVLQTQRMSREANDGFEMATFLEEEKALAYLAG